MMRTEVMSVRLGMGYIASAASARHVRGAIRHRGLREDTEITERPRPSSPRGTQTSGISGETREARENFLCDLRVSSVLSVSKSTTIAESRPPTGPAPTRAPQQRPCRCGGWMMRTEVMSVRLGMGYIASAASARHVRGAIRHRGLREDTEITEITIGVIHGTYMTNRRMPSLRTRVLKFNNRPFGMPLSFR